MIEDVRLIFDAGTLVLIWLVQLVIYPGLRYYAAPELVRWHPRYTVRVSYVVLPLMVGQLGTSIWMAYVELNWYTVASLLLLAGLWASTFLQFVPLHGRISQGETDPTITASLERLNWVRTVGWSLLFGLTVVDRFVV